MPLPLISTDPIYDQQKYNNLQAADHVEKEADDVQLGGSFNTGHRFKGVQGVHAWWNSHENENQ